MLTETELRIIHQKLLQQAILIPNKCILLTFADVVEVLNNFTVILGEEENGHRREGGSKEGSKEESEEGSTTENEVDEDITEEPDSGSSES